MANTTNDYRDRSEEPVQGQLCLCRCPGWNKEGFQVAVYRNGMFGYHDQPNGFFDSEVDGWIPLNIFGVPK